MKSENVKLEAKQIMDNFMASMKDIEVTEDFVLEREACFREEITGDSESEKEIEERENFRQMFLANARKISGDAILANKAEWQ